MIKPKAKVIFDWDNTLKIYRKSDQTLSSRIAKDRLLYWKNSLSCELFIISAIQPSRMNMETILLEVDKLNLMVSLPAKTIRLRSCQGSMLEREQLLFVDMTRQKPFWNWAMLTTKRMIISSSLMMSLSTYIIFVPLFHGVNVTLSSNIDIIILCVGRFKSLYTMYCFHCMYIL